MADGLRQADAQSLQHGGQVDGDHGNGRRRVAGQCRIPGGTVSRGAHPEKTIGRPLDRRSGRRRILPLPSGGPARLI